MIYSLASDCPQIDPSAWVAPNATIIGKVICHPYSSVWYGAVLRGDNDTITLGEACNVQDGTVMHTDLGKPLILRRRVLVGHLALLHGCDIDEGTLIGMGSTIMNGVKIGKHCLIGARTLIGENKTIPDRSFVLGSPGKIIREVTDAEIAHIEWAIDHYVAQAKKHRLELKTSP